MSRYLGNRRNYIYDSGFYYKWRKCNRRLLEQSDRSGHQPDCTSYYVESNKGRPGYGRCKTVQYTWIPVWNLRITVYVIVFVRIMCTCIHRPVDHKEEAFERCTADGAVYLAGIPCGSIIDTDIGKVNRNETVNVNYNMFSRADGIWMDVRIHVNRR